MNHTSFTHDLAYSLIAVAIILVVALVGLACLVVAGGALWLFTGWLANLIATADDQSRAGLAIGTAALLALLAAEWRRAR